MEKSAGWRQRNSWTEKDARQHTIGHNSAEKIWVVRSEAETGADLLQLYHCALKGYSCQRCSALWNEAKPATKQVTTGFQVLLDLLILNGNVCTMRFLIFSCDIKYKIIKFKNDALM
jgi:hypothetical protein